MKAVALEGKTQLKLIEAAQLKANDKKVLIKVEKVGICGSDLHMWHNGEPAGLIMGHEFAGTVVDPGPAQGIFKVGERVTAMPTNPCGECKYCKKLQYNACTHMFDDAPGISTPGAYAEYLLVNPGSIYKLPGNMTMEEGAMVEPSAVALHAVNLAGIAPGDKVLIVGAGIIGLLCAAWARICGAAYIALSETNPARREKAFKYGDVDEVFDASEPKLQKKLLALTDGGFDKTFECAGPAPAVNFALGATGFGGKTMLVGIDYNAVPISTMRVNLREIEIKGSYGYTSDEFALCIDYIARRILKVERFIDDILGLDMAQSAFERLADPSGSAVKIMFKP